VRTGGDISGCGSEVVRVISVEGVAGDELEAGRLKGSGLSEEYTLGERREHRRRVVVKGGIKATRVVALQPWAFHRPFRKYTVFGGERWGPGKCEVRCLFPEGADPIHLVRPCPSLGKLLP